MFYTIAYRHCFIHSRTDGKGETFVVGYPSFNKKNTEHKTLHGAKLAITRDWREYCENARAWRAKNGPFTFNVNIKPCI